MFAIVLYFDAMYLIELFVALLFLSKNNAGVILELCLFET